MTRPTRYFLLGASLILLLGVGTGLVAYYRGDLRSLAPRVGPAELAYVPAGATGLAYANVREFMDSEVHRKLQQVMPTGQGRDEFFRQTGIDIEKDIQSVVAAAADKGDPSGHGLVLIRGTFDQGRIETLVRNGHGTVEDYKGRRLMTLPNHAPNGVSDHPCLMFPEAGLAMFGTEATLKQAIDTRESGRDVTANSDSMKLVAEIDGTGNTAWAVGGIDVLTSNPNVPPQVRSQLPALEWVAVSAHVNGTVNGRLMAQAKDDKAASDLRAVVNGAIAAGHLMAGTDQRIDSLLNSLQLSGTGRELSLTFTVPPDIFEMIHGGMPKPDAATPLRR